MLVFVFPRPAFQEARYGVRKYPFLTKVTLNRALDMKIAFALPNAHRFVFPNFEAQIFNKKRFIVDKMRRLYPNDNSATYQWSSHQKAYYHQLELG